jgi:hypothetical protein
MISNMHPRCCCLSISSQFFIRLDGVDDWGPKKDICRVLIEEQASLVHDLLELTCTSRMPAPYQDWCVQDDSFHPLWYNTANRKEFELSWVRPAHIPVGIEIPPPAPIVPTAKDEHIVSKFIFLDETTGRFHTEYIEPLVSHLRFPLCKCIQPFPVTPSYVPPPGTPEYEYYATMFRGWIIPPPPGVGYGVKKYYFDAGASSWSGGKGGPSLSYFKNMWERHGVNFDEIYAFEMTTSPADFDAAMPDFMKDHVFYQQCAVSSHAEEDSPVHPFLPMLIERKTDPNDYVLFKLDIDSPKVEDGNIFYILDDPNNNIDEVVWEHHVRGNYLLTEWRGGRTDQEENESLLNNLTLRQSYEFFLKMRQKGIRAHSWI